MVRAFVAILLGFALTGTAGQSPWLHIHAYIDHDHPEHHHGPAAHEHQQSTTHHHDDRASLESCDPGQHSVPFTLGCAPLPHVNAIDAASANPSIVDPLVPLRSVHHLTDVRVHGPPPLTQAPPRAPPLIFPA